MQLLKSNCKRKGYEKYVDLSLTWEHDGKSYTIRIKPVFNKDFKFLLAHAQEME